MKTTIDRAGRLVIPKQIRQEAGLKPGASLDVQWENGKIAVTPVPLPVKMVRRGRLLVAVADKPIPVLTGAAVERTRKALRQGRSSHSS